MKTIKYIISFMLLTVLVIAGCEGPVGSKGEQGEQGIPGPVGPAGENGTKIHAGSEKPEDTLGEPGDFYLNLVTGELYGPKEESGWGDSPLHLTGADGQDGKDGENGTDGKDGADGQDGADGKDGKDGSRIYADNGAPPNGLGNNGDFYLDTGSYFLYGPKKSGSWGSPINLQGPAGPKGEQGEPGPEGPQGPPGEDGKDGNANVIYSDWITAGEWQNHGTSGAYFIIEVPEIAQEIIDSGDVRVYYRTNESDPRAFPLPVFFWIGLSGVEYYNYLVTGDEDILIYNRRMDGADVFPVSTLQFRYIIIPGGVQAGKMQEDFWEDYENVKDYFGIPG